MYRGMQQRVFPISQWDQLKTMVKDSGRGNTQLSVSTAAALVVMSEGAEPLFLAQNQIFIKVVVRSIANLKKDWTYILHKCNCYEPKLPSTTVFIKEWSKAVRGWEHDTTTGIVIYGWIAIKLSSGSEAIVRKFQGQTQKGHQTRSQSLRKA